MAKSDYAFLSGEAVDVGTHGEHDYRDWEFHVGWGGDSPSNGARVDKYLDGGLAHMRIYDRVLSQSEIQAYIDAATGGSLTTASKSFSSGKQPDLQNLVYSLNGGSVDIDVIWSPGTASEEIVNSGTLDGTQTGVTLTWSSNHTNFRVRPNLSTPGVGNLSPSVSQIELS